MNTMFPQPVGLFPSFRRKPQEGARFLTQRVYHDWLDRLIMLDTAIFKWKGLPITIDERFLELTLCRVGKALFMYDEVIGVYLGLPCNFGGDFNINGIPYTRYAFSYYNSYHKTCNPYDSVIIPNNYLFKDHFTTLELYAHRLTEIQRTQDINLHAQRTPILIKTPKEQELTMRNMYHQYDEFSPMIVGSKEVLDISSIEVLQTEAPFIADKTDILLHNILNEALSYMGYDNANQDKRERLVADEVNANNGLIMGQRNERLILRQKAANEINALFGLNVSVDVREDLVVAEQVPYKSNIGAYAYNYGGTIEAKLKEGGSGV